MKRGFIKENSKESVIIQSISLYRNFIVFITKFILYSAIYYILPIHYIFNAFKSTLFFNVLYRRFPLV